MERNGNTTGMGPRRQDEEDEAHAGDRQQRQERLADEELKESEAAVGRVDQADGAEGDTTAGEESARPEAASQADGTPYGSPSDRSPEGVKPATRDRLEAADVDADAERAARQQGETE